MARGSLGMDEILESVGMVGRDHLDIRTVTMGIDLRGCRTPEDVVRRVTTTASGLVAVTDAVAAETGVPIVNRRVSVTPIAWVAERPDRELILDLARAMDEAGQAVGVDFIGGLSALVEKRASRIDEELMASLPVALAETRRVCASVNIATTGAGINMDAVRLMGEVIRETAERTATASGIGCAKIVVFANAVPDNPFMAGAVHGAGEPEVSINVAISGPGVIRNVVAGNPGIPFTELADLIKRTTFKITRIGELVAREASALLGAQMGIIDLSLAPSPKVGDSVAEILESMGLERVGAPGSTAALALLNDAVKKGGTMATSSTGGLSGAFIPVSEDAGMARAAEEGVLTIEKLEAMTAVCSLGLDMIVVPGDISRESLAGMIADVMAIGMVNGKTTGARLIPAIGRKVGDQVTLGGLFGAAPVMPVSRAGNEAFMARGGRIPAPLQSLTN